MLRSIFASMQGRVGAFIVIFVVLWQALSIWQTADFLPSRMTALANFLDGPWGPTVLVILGFVFMYRAVSARWPDSQTEATSESETQQRQRTQHAPIDPRPEPQPAPSDEPFSLEPIKRRGSPKPNGEFDIYMSIRVANKGSGWIRGCRGRLVRVQKIVSTPDGHELQDNPHIHPAYLRWSPGDGGGDSADFTMEATLDVAVIESWTEPVYKILTANESLHPTYQLEYGQVGSILTIEISAQSGGRIEQIFSLDGHFRGFLEAPTEMEPEVRWRKWP